MQNEAQYDLDRKTAEIYALFSNNLAGKDLGLKSNTIEQAKFEYSRFGKDFTKGLDKEQEKKGAF